MLRIQAEEEDASQTVWHGTSRPSAEAAEGSALAKCLRKGSRALLWLRLAGGLARKINASDSEASDEVKGISITERPMYRAYHLSSGAKTKWPKARSLLMFPNLLLLQKFPAAISQFLLRWKSRKWGRWGRAPPPHEVLLTSPLLRLEGKNPGELPPKLPQKELPRPGEGIIPF